MGGFMPALSPRQPGRRAVAGVARERDAPARGLRREPRFPVVKPFHGGWQGSAGDGPDCNIALPAATARGKGAVVHFGLRGYAALRHLVAPGAIPAPDLGPRVGALFDKCISGIPPRAPFDAFGFTPLHY